MLRECSIIFTAMIFLHLENTKTLAEAQQIPAEKNANSIEKKIPVKDWRYLHSYMFGHQVAPHWL